MNDDREFVGRLERWLDAVDPPGSSARLGEEILLVLPRVRQQRARFPLWPRRTLPSSLRYGLIAAAAILAVAGLTVWLNLGTSRPPPPAPTPSPAISPTPAPTPSPTRSAEPYPELIKEIRMREDTWQVLATPTRIWVQVGDLGARAIDPETGQPGARVDGVSWMFLDGDELWAQLGNEKTLLVLDPETGRELDRYKDIPGYFVLKDGDTVWSPGPSDTQFLRTDLATGRRLAAIDVPASPKQAVLAGGSVWVICDDGSALVRIDRSTEQLVDTIDVGAGPVEIEVGFGSLWIRNRQGELVRVDPSTGAVLAVIPGFATSPSLGLSTGGGWVWASRRDGMGRIDPATNKVVATLRLPQQPLMDSAWRNNELWVSTAGVRSLLQVDASGS